MHHGMRHEIDSIAAAVAVAVAVMDECKSLVSRLYNNDCMNACSFCFGKRLMDIKLGSTVEPITHELRFCRRMQQVYMKGGTTAGTEDGGGAMTLAVARTKTRRSSLKVVLVHLDHLRVHRN